MKQKRNISPVVKNDPVIIEKANGINWWRIIFPHLMAVIIFLFVTFLFFSPMITGNKVISQSDIIQGKGASKELADYRERTGHEALWTNSMFGGMPGYQISTYYKGNVLRFVNDILTVGLPHPSGLLFIAFLGFYILLIVLNVNPWLSMIGALAFGLSSYDLIILNAGHNSKMAAIGFMPMVIAGILLLFRGRYLLGAALTALSISLEIRANHLQIAYYLFLMLLVLGVVEFIYAIREKKLKHFFIASSLILLCGGAGVLSNLSLLWSTSEYAKETIRGKSELTSNKQSSGGLDEDYAFRWSYGKLEAMTLLIPNFYGGSSGAPLGENSNSAEKLRQQGASGEQLKQYLKQMPLYWGAQPFTSGPVYLGAIICFLFVLGLFLVRGPMKWWLLAAAILSLLLSFGRHFMILSDIFFKYFPVYNNFRTVSMILVIAQAAVPLLALITLSGIIKKEFDQKLLISRLKISLYITGGLCLFFAVIGAGFLDFKSEQDSQIPEWLLGGIIDDRKSLLRMDALRSLAFILFSAGLIWAYSTNRIKETFLIAGIGVLVFADLFFVGKRYLGENDFVTKQDYRNYFEPTSVDQSILQDRSIDYRVLNLTTDTYNDSHTSFFHKSVGGYHAAKLRRYQELIDHHLNRADVSGKRTSPNIEVLNMLNTKYVIVPAGKNQPPVVQANPQAAGNAWFVDSIKIVNNADEEIKSLDNFNPRNIAFVDKRFLNQLTGYNTGKDSASVIQLKNYEPNHLLYQSNSSKAGAAIFSEIYYDKGWKATVDDKDANYFRANYVLRGMLLPAGQHKIEFKFEPQSYLTGEKVALIASLMILLLAFAAAGYEISLLLKRR